MAEIQATAITSTPTTTVRPPSVHAVRLEVPTSPSTPVEVIEAHHQVIKSLLDHFIEEAQHENDSPLLSPKTALAAPVHTLPPELPLQTIQEIEDFVSKLSTLYQLYGCPTHVIEINMPGVAKGLGAQMDFAVFPTHTLITTSRNDGGVIKRNTIYFRTRMGLDMYRLQLVDELVRRIQSYATVTAPKIQRRSVDASTAGGLAATTASEGHTETPLVNEGLDLKQRILQLASFGPGFFSDVFRHHPEHTHKRVASVDQLDEKSTVHPDLASSASAGTSRRNHDVIEMEATRKRRKTKTAFLRNHNKYEYMFSKIALSDGAKHLETIQSANPVYPRYISWGFNGLSAAGCAGLFFGGNGYDMLISFILGMLVGALGSLQIKLPAFARLYEFTAAFCVTLSVRLIHKVLPLCFRGVVLGSIVWLLQGVSLALSIIELMTKNLVSGTVRLVNGIAVSALLGFGLDSGTQAYAIILGIDKNDAFLETACSPERALSPGWIPLLFLITSCSFNSLMNSHPKQLLPMLLSSSCAYATLWLMKTYGVAGFEALVASFVASCVSNLYSRYSGNPAIIYALSGLLVMVPGSLATSSFQLIFQGDVQGGIGLALGVAKAAFSLGIGVFFASLVVAPRKESQYNPDEPKPSGLQF